MQFNELESALAEIKANFEASLRLKDGVCTITFVNQCPQGKPVYIAGAVASFHYDDNTNSPNVQKNMNVGPQERDEMNSPATDKCVQNVIGIMAVMVNGNLYPGGMPFSASVPADRCLRGYTTAVTLAKGLLEDSTGIELYKDY